MTQLRLPDFVIIGATKSATTWLSHNLSEHPDIFLPSQELHYFSRHHDEGEGWYGAHFTGAQAGQLVGEKSASYLSDAATPDRLRRLLPRAMLIAQLRHPVERAYSDYCMHYRRGQVGRDIERYLDPARTPIPRLLEDGFYHRHLMNYGRAFAPAQIKVLLYDDIRERPRQVFREVCEYLGIDDGIAPEAVQRRVKDKEVPVVPPSARRLLAPLKTFVKPYRQTRAFVAIRSLIARRLRYPSLTSELRQRLARYYADDIAGLSELLGRDLSHWCYANACDGAPPRDAGSAPSSWVDHAA